MIPQNHPFPIGHMEGPEGTFTKESCEARGDILLQLAEADKKEMVTWSI